MQSLHIVKSSIQPAAEGGESITPERTNPYVASVARQYLNQGLSFAELIAAGEEAWQAAHRHYGEGSDRLARFGSFWVREGILTDLHAPPNYLTPPE